MRGSIEMNTLKQIASRAIVFVLALSVLVPAVIMSGDNNVVQAEKLATLYLTNKGTAKTTEASPPSARANPASRVNTSTLYATMSDVDTGNVAQNSHILDANKVVITVVESDYNKKVVVDGGAKDIGGTKIAVGGTLVVAGSQGDPVIDTDGDGDLTDEISAVTVANDEHNADATIDYDGSAWARVGDTPGAISANVVWTVVSVANGSSATASVSPNVTLFMADDTGHAANDDVFIGYYSSAVNTFQVHAWSTVQLESNASVISVVETGRNTGVFEAEFIIADTEGSNDNLTETTQTIGTTNNGDFNNTQCGTTGVNGTAGDTIVDGRFDRSGGINADCEMMVTNDLDTATGDITAGNALKADLAIGTLAAGQFIIDTDNDGSILDEFYFANGHAQGLAAGNVGRANDTGKIQVTSVTCGGTLAKCTDGTGGNIVIVSATAGANITNGGGGNDIADVITPIGNNIVDNQKVDSNLGGAVEATDLLTGRVGMDSLSAGGSAGTSSVVGTFTTGIDRTPVVEAQANSTVTVQYKDLTDNNSATAAATGTKVKETVTIDVDAPTPIVSSPTNGSSFKDRQPSFAGSATDIGAGIDVSTATLYVDVADLVGGDTAASLMATTGAWLGSAGSIDLKDEYRAIAVTLDNTTTMTDGVSSVSWTVTTSTNIPCLTVNNDGSTPNSDGGASHTNFANVATTCNDAKSEPDVSLDYFSSVTDLAGNRGFSDAITTDTNDGPSLKDNYSFNIDELKPSLDAANTETGVYWNAGTTAEKNW